jgi:hypothetical protein
MFALITPRANCTMSKNVEKFNLSYAPARRSKCALLIGREPSDTISPQSGLFPLIGIL